ncbi:hypothetical protein JCM17960_16140 [Magnetospira thiophila]
MMTLAGLLWASSMPTWADGVKASAAPLSNLVILGQDAAPDLPRRDSPAYRLLAERLSAALDRDGYRIFQESNITLASHHPENTRRSTQEAIAAAQALKRPAMDRAVILSVAPEVNARDMLFVQLTGQVVDLPSGQVIDTVSMRARDAQALPEDCHRACRGERILDLTRHLSPSFAQEVAERLAHAAGTKEVDPRGYSVILQDFKPQEIRTLLRTLDDYGDRLDYWSVGRTERSRILWVETSAKPRQMIRAIHRLLENVGMSARIIRSDRGFTLIRSSRTELSFLSRRPD